MVRINTKLLMEDELLYSYITRLADANGFSVNDFALNYIYPDNVEKAQNPKFLIGNLIYVPKIASIVEQDPLDLYLKTTTYPGIAPLLTPGRQVRFINMAFRKNIWKYPHMHEKAPGSSPFRFCPLCMEEDIREHNFTWLRRKHNMPCVTACSKHKVNLVETGNVQDLLTGHISSSQIELSYATEREISFAEFAGDFLYACFDTDKNILIQNISAELSKTNGMDIYGKTDMNYFRKSIKVNKYELGVNTILNGLFEIFHKVSNIPVKRNEELYDEFMSSLKAYKLLSDYYEPCVIMKRMGEKTPFVTTPYAFLAGWRSPNEDYDDEQKKFVRIVKCTRHGEYEPVEHLKGMRMPMKFRHEICGQIVKIRPIDLIENNANCSCMQNYVKNDSYIETPGAYTILSVENNRILTVEMHKCGHVFAVPIEEWFITTRCRVCGMEKYITKDEAFRREVEALVGDEYVVTGKYVGTQTPVAIKHLKCGKTMVCTPERFFQGKRCDCEKDSYPKGEDFIKFVHDKSNGKYEIVGRDKKTNYFIRNVENGKQKCMAKAYIIQELTRPTPSTVLP